MRDIKFGQDFGRALCKHFNLPAGQTGNLKLNTGFGELLGASLTIHLKPSDLIAIGALMQQDSPGKQPAESSAPTDPLLAEAKRTNELLQKLVEHTDRIDACGLRVTHEC